MDEAIDEISESVRANMHILADRIRILRNEKGISAREMSLALGQNVNYINLIENGKRSPSFELFFDICDFYLKKIHNPLYINAYFFQQLPASRP